MKKINNLLLIIISYLMVFVSCSNEVVIDEDINQTEQFSEKTILITVSVPTTRIALEKQEDNSVALTWESGDKLQLLFVQGDTKAVQNDVTISSISNGGKTATFEIVVPTEIESGSFDIYGVYGGGGLSTVDPTHAILPINPGTANSLESVQDREDAMLYFSTKDVDLSNPKINVSFKHIGSLFAINLKNNSESELSNIAVAKLTSRSGGWAYNSGTGGGLFNLVTGEFENPVSAGNFISFALPQSSVPSGEIITLWGWYPPLADVEWPNISLQLLDEDDVVIVESNNFRHGGKIPSVAKNYYFNANWNGITLEFANTSFESLSGFKDVEERFTISQESLPAPFNIANQLVSMAVSGNQLILKTGYNSTLARGDIFSFNALTGVYESALGTHHGINRLATDSQGRIVGPNQANVGGNMILFKLDNVNSSREEIYSSTYNGEAGTIWGNGAAVGVYGDISKNAVIFSPVHRSGKTPVTYRFVIENGSLSSAPELIEYGSYSDEPRYSPFGNIGFGIPAGAKVEDGYIFGDREEFAYFKSNKKYIFKDEDTGTWTYGGTGGGKVFDMNGKKYFAVWRSISENYGLFNILDITNPEAITMSEEQRETAGINFVVYQSEQFDTTLGKNGGFFGNIDVMQLDNGNVMLYFMFGNAGVKAYELIKN